MNLKIEPGTRRYCKSFNNAIGSRDYPGLVHAFDGGLHTWQHILCSDESRFPLPSLKQWTLSCAPQAWGELYRPVSVRVRLFWSRRYYGLGCAGICHDRRAQLKIVQGSLNAVKYKDDIIDPIGLPFLQQRNVSTSFNMTM